MKNTYRFFVSPAAFSGDMVQIDDRDLVHQWNSVLRLRLGQHIALLDGSGRGYIVELTALDKRSASGRVITEYGASGEPATAVTLFVALTRGERFEWVLQKGTELGATAFVPLLCERSQAETSANKQERWLRIIREAAEQAGRGLLPELRPATAFKQAAAQGRHGLFLAESGTTVPFKAALAARPHGPLSLWSGPEGGWSDGEILLAEQSGLVAVTLGRRILRAETAPIAALAAIMFARDEWIGAEL
jgi:16S rRNA (uracil1498-N3)-methyltransferase